MNDTFTEWMLTGKEASAAPTAVYGHGPGGLFSHAALSKPMVGAAIEGWRKRKRSRRLKDADAGGEPMADYFLANDLDALLNGGGARVKGAEPVAVETAPVMAGGALTMQSTPAGDEFVEWFVTRGKSWDESKHPRGGKGTPGGGKFAPKGGGDPDNRVGDPAQEEDDANRQALQDRNLSQQTDAHAAAAGAVQGETDFERPVGPVPAVSNIGEIWDKLDNESKSSAIDAMAGQLKQQGYDDRYIMLVKKALIK